MTNVIFQSGAIDAPGCISSAWDTVTRRFWLYIGVGLLTMVLLGCLPIVGFFLLGPVLGGFYYLVLRDMRDESVDFGMMFKGFEKFVPLMVAGLIQSAPSIIATILQYTVDLARLTGAGGSSDATLYQSGTETLFAGLSAMVVAVVLVLSLLGIVWSVALSFAVPLIMEHNLPIGDALVTSVKAALGNVGGLIVLIIFEALVVLLGVLALCVGIFVAVPVIYTANVFAYRYVFPYIEASSFNATPPPPTEYGGTYGTNY